MKLISRLVFGLQFRELLPNITQANGRMEAEEYGQWCGDVREYRPTQRAVEVQLHWCALATSRFQRVDSPHGEVADQQEGYHLSARLATYLV